jgi:5-methylthioadenosine/S-adenosylhomocysteine deaminase
VRAEEANAPHRQFFEKVEPVVNTFCPGLAKMPHHIDRFGGGHHGHERTDWVQGSPVR